MSAPARQLASRAPDALLGRSPRLQRKCGCGASGTHGETCRERTRKMVQSDLAVGSAEDPLEHEADRVADRAMASSAPGDLGAVPVLTEPTVAESSDTIQSAPSSVERTLTTGGRPLEPAVRDDMERRLGHDFFDVRVHADAQAEASARDISAQAFTVGRHIAFGAGYYAPQSTEGRRLLAHELTHVVQQGAGATMLRVQSKKKDPGKTRTPAKAPKPKVAKICGRASRKVKDNSITKVNLDVGSNQLTIEWKDPANEPEVSKGTHPISPGAGKCCVDCNDEATSQTDGSLCTPKGGTWTVSSTDCHLGGHPSAKNPSYFQRGGVAIHSGNTSSPPQSHGCARTLPLISELVHDNVVVGTTEVAVSGTWAGSKCYLNAKTDALSNRDDVCDGTELKHKRAKQKSKKAAVLEGESPQEPLVDGPGPHNEPASDDGISEALLADLDVVEGEDEGAGEIV